jgi:hypothetical protein
LPLLPLPRRLGTPDRRQIHRSPSPRSTKSTSFV